jgi:hypothetical protein
MFEKFTKWFANKAADGAVAGVKTSINEKVDQYGDIIRIGLVIGITALGVHHITKQNSLGPPGNYPMRLPQSGHQPIVINNYYPGYLNQGYSTSSTRARNERRYSYERSYYIPQQTRTPYKKR